MSHRKVFPSDLHGFTSPTPAPHATGYLTKGVHLVAGVLLLVMIAGQPSPLMAQPMWLSGGGATTTTSPLFPTLFNTPSAPSPQHLTASTSYTPQALSCSINTACADAAWSPEISAVVNVRRGSSATCTGVLINNTRQDQTAYVLTAYHCGSPTTGQHVDWTIEFSYESTTCADPAETPVPQMLTGATVVAALGSSYDYVLLRLDDPIPASYDADFAGWSLETTPALNGTVIGHPKGDIKKITYDDDVIVNAGDYWLAEFDRGTIEAASSGAPLFNHNHQVVGLVRSAISIDHDACSGPGGDDNAAQILFPKLHLLWAAGPPGEKLADFLDPDGTGATTLGSLEGTGEVLPVELVSFDAVLDGRTVHLAWTTASETNNAGFEIQMRQTNHTDWNALSWIDGHGTTEVEQNYSFQITDLQPGRHSFRLKQIDYDGTFEYSPEVEVVVEMAERFVMEPAHPNPFNPEATFRFAVSRAQTVEVALFDLLGRRVEVLWHGEAEAGRMQEVRLDGSGLPSGVYLVRAAGEGFVETQRVSLIK